MNALRFKALNGKLSGEDGIAVLEIMDDCQRFKLKASAAERQLKAWINPEGTTKYRTQARHITRLTETNKELKKRLELAEAVAKATQKYVEDQDVRFSHSTAIRTWMYELKPALEAWQTHKEKQEPIVSKSQMKRIAAQKGLPDPYDQHTCYEDHDCANRVSDFEGSP